MCARVCAVLCCAVLTLSLGLRDPSGESLIIIRISSLLSLIQLIPLSRGEGNHAQ